MAARDTIPAIPIAPRIRAFNSASRRTALKNPTGNSAAFI
jgi:hypothetical protein